MKAVLASVALLAAAASAQSGFSINTPTSVVECEPTQLDWSGGTPPYFLSILPGNSPSSAAIESFPETNSTTLTWTVNIASGVSIGFTLRDSTGAIAQTAAVTVQAGSSSSCVNTTVSSTPGSTSGSVAPSSSAGASATSPVATSSSGSSGSSGTTASPSSSASSSTSSSGASANVAQLGIAGVAGVALAALFF